MLVGPAGLGLLLEAPLERLMTLERGALGVIALAAGAELRVAELHRTRRQARTAKADLVLMDLHPSLCSILTL